jgi:hypothetical protein
LKWDNGWQLVKWHRVWHWLKLVYGWNLLFQDLYLMREHNRIINCNLQTEFLPYRTTKMCITCI